MSILASVLIAVGAGTLWAMALRRSRSRRRVIDAPPTATAALRAYTKGRWDRVIAVAPQALAAPDDVDDDSASSSDWRPAVELAFGHSLVQRDRFAEAIPHLERGLLLQAARRRRDGLGDAPTASEAKLRHLLGFSHAATGDPIAAAREYRRVLATPQLDPSIASRVRSALDQLAAEDPSS